MKFIPQTLLLMWKNLLLKRQSKLATLIEIALPLLCAVLLGGLDKKSKPIEKKALVFPASNVYKKSTAPPNLFPIHPDNTVFFVPNTALARTIITKTFVILQLVTNETVDPSIGNYIPTLTGLDDEETLKKPRRIKWIGVVFNNLGKSTTLPKDVSYTIVPDAERELSNKQFTQDLKKSEESPEPKRVYEHRGYLALQAALSQTLISMWAGKDVDFELFTQPMSHPAAKHNPSLQMFRIVVPLIFLFSLIVSVFQATKMLVTEKESKLKESMKLMGMIPSAYWASWFLSFFLYLLIIVILYILALQDVFWETDKGLLLLFLILYAAAIVSYGIMMSVFFNSAQMGGTMSGAVFFMSFIPWVQLSRKGLGRAKGMLMSLALNSAMGYGVTAFVNKYREGKGGVNWSNFDQVTYGDDMSVKDALIMLTVDTILYMFIAWYVDTVFPGEFGVPQPFYFFLTIFNGTHYAVNNLTLNLYEGQITVLLGHNGAGKSTTMFLLTGFFPPSSGTAFVNGYNIRTDLARVRESLGLCPQHNVLFDTLSTREHFYFFAKLKGCPSSKVKEEVEKMLKETGLQEKAGVPSGTLSGGQKRRLSVGIALIHGSKVVILDEPTAGVDPSARRQMWDLLQRHRSGRTIMLSTHFMDEADALGDRIAIMAEGKLVCCGSGMFLKKLYGTGYHLIIVKRDDCQVSDITKLIRIHISGSKFKKEVKSELFYLLPDNQLRHFPELFRQLETQKEELGIVSFGATATTMEDVFLRVGQTLEGETEPPQQSVGGRKEEASSTTDSETAAESESGPGSESSVDVDHGAVDKNANNPTTAIELGGPGYQKLTGMELLTSQIRALVVKKFLFLQRSALMTVVLLVLPLGFVVVANLPETKEKKHDTGLGKEQDVHYDLEDFDPVIVTYMVDGSDSDVQKLAKLYTEQFESTVTFKQLSSNGKPMPEQLKVLLPRINYNHIIGAEFGKLQGKLTVWSYFNGYVSHGEPIALNYVLNSLASYFAPGHTISGSLHVSAADSRTHDQPLDTPEDRQDEMMQFMPLAMAFMVPIYVSSLYKEKAVGAKHLQMVSGLSPTVFWLTTLVFDFTLVVLQACAVALVFYLFKTPTYTEDGRLLYVVMILLLYGWAFLSCVYLGSFLFSSHATGNVAFIIYVIVTGMIVPTTMYVKRISVYIVYIGGAYSPDPNDLVNAKKETDTMVDEYHSYNRLFTLTMPPYCMTTAFVGVAVNYVNNYGCRKFNYSKTALFGACVDDCDSKAMCFYYGVAKDYLSTSLPGIGMYLGAMAAQGLVVMLVLLLYESQTGHRLVNHLCHMVQTVIGGKAMAQSMEEDSDVAAERQRINATSVKQLTQQEKLVLVNLHKQYGNLVAVNKACVGVQEQECFGLLGQNGAGKTTIFKMLTGDVIPTSGNAYLNGNDIDSHLNKVRQDMGYCPQFDALHEMLTGLETLTFYARLKGIPAVKRQSIVKYLIEHVKLTPHAQKPSGTYSGGNKRKLSLAISLLGEPRFVLLDEPSSGMDAAAKHAMWEVLSDARASGKTLVLTSHSMEECEALCTKVVIMVNGRFMCLGSTQHLKNKFGQGYTLIIKLATEQDGVAPSDPFLAFVRTSYPGAYVFDQHERYVHIQVPDPDKDVALADIFELLEKAVNKKELHVLEYAVQQTSLEQVFLHFARQQVTPTIQPTLCTKVHRKVCPCCG